MQTILFGTNAIKLTDDGANSSPVVLRKNSVEVVSGVSGSLTNKDKNLSHKVCVSMVSGRTIDIYLSEISNKPTWTVDKAGVDNAVNEFYVFLNA